MSEKTILALDPGNHTGWYIHQSIGPYDRGGTILENHVEVAELLRLWRPDIVVIERFNLYPHMAKSLAWNSFYPCEVIGVIRYLCQVYNTPLVEQAPSVKKYYGGTKDDWDLMKQHSTTVTEHTKDAYMHYRYFIRNGLKRYK